jgi:hypothetical protein
MGEMTSDKHTPFTSPFNGPVEIGLRALAVLNYAFPDAYSLQRLVILDYLIVHSDDVPGGPRGLHPKTPHRSGELLVRRSVLQQGLLLYQSRALLERRFDGTGISFCATERSASFLDALGTEYVRALRERAQWLVHTYGNLPDKELDQLVRDHLGDWGAEFELESVLWSEDWP